MNTAVVNAQNLVNSALSALRSTTFGTPRYTTWLGTFDVTRKIAMLADYTVCAARDHLRQEYLADLLVPVHRKWTASELHVRLYL